MFSRLKRHADAAPAAAGPKWYAADEASAAGAGATEPDSAQPTEAKERIEDYLDHVAAELLVLPRARRQEIRAELRQHIQALVQAHEELGNAPKAATLAALMQFGDPARIGRAFAQTWRPAVSETERTASPVAAMKQGLVWFGGAAAFWGLEYAGAVATGTPIATSRFVSLWLLLPIAAGWQVGRRAPARAGLGAFYALSLIALATCPFVFWSLRYGPPPFFTLVLIAHTLGLWIPLGTLSAAVSGALKQRRSRRLRHAR